MINLGLHRTERTGAMRLELRPNQLNDIIIIAKAVAGTVQRNKTLALSDKVQQRFRLFLTNGINVGINDEASVILQRRRVQILHLIGIDQFNAPLLHHGLQLLEPYPRLMMTIVSKVKELETLGLAADGEEKDGKQADEFGHDDSVRMDIGFSVKYGHGDAMGWSAVTDQMLEVEVNRKA